MLMEFSTLFVSYGIEHRLIPRAKDKLPSVPAYAVSFLFALRNFLRLLYLMELNTG